VSNDVDGILETLETHRDEALRAMDRSNPRSDFDSVEDVYDELSPFDESRTYEVELELDEYELVALVSNMMEVLSTPSPANEVIVRTTILAKLVDEVPEHVERLSALDETDEDIRGFQ
jgi:hypothetical protein